MPLYDQYGNVVRTSELRRELAGPTVTGVRSILSEHPAQGLTPGRLGALLREAEHGDARGYLALAEEMEEKNLHYNAVLGTRKRQVAQLDIHVEEAGDGADEKRDADLVRDWLTGETLDDELVDILDAIGKGYSASEIMWDVGERQWMPRRLEYRDPRWFEFDRIDGRKRIYRQLRAAARSFCAATKPSRSGVLAQCLRIGRKNGNLRVSRQIHISPRLIARNERKYSAASNRWFPAKTTTTMTQNPVRSKASSAFLNLAASASLDTPLRAYSG